MDVGARLKDARIAKGLSLDALQDTTKIQKRYLAAIEEGNFHILPGKFYARAFIKEYANAVGIEPNELLEEHKEEIPKSETERDIQYTRVERSRRDSTTNDRSGMIFSLLPKIIVILLIVGIIVAAIWFYLQSGSDNEPTEVEEGGGTVIIESGGPSSDNGSEDTADEDNNADETEEQEEVEEEVEEEPQEIEFEVVETGTGATPESTISMTNPDDELIFVFQSEARSWLDVQNGDGEVFFSGFVSAEEEPLEIDMTGQNTIYINAGSTPNLQITVNDTAFEYPVDPNQNDVQRIWIDVN